MNDRSDPLFISVGLRKWSSKPETNKPLSILYTAEATKGWVKYNGSGTLDKNYYKLRGEAYLGLGINQITPIVGLGYRYLYDDSGGKTSSTGALSYDRQSEYIYLPAGLLINVDGGVSFKGQFNYLINGSQTSYLSDIDGFSDVKNNQSSGWGIDVSLNYKISDKITLYSFYRYWDIKKSDIGTGTFEGILIFNAFEPENTTSETGLGLAYSF
ncbi:MAG: hypothetical protein VX617_02450 [Pseudomonadota bacterium]|nr:hypothetical protein [Pseudomonadota bacterium]